MNEHVGLPDTLSDNEKAILDIIRTLRTAAEHGVTVDRKIIDLIETVTKRMEMLEARIGYLETRVTISQNYITGLEARLNAEGK